jgi:hypothetical protein
MSSEAVNYNLRIVSAISPGFHGFSSIYKTLCLNLDPFHHKSIQLQQTQISKLKTKCLCLPTSRNGCVPCPKNPTKKSPKHLKSTIFHQSSSSILGYPKGWSMEQCFSWMHNRMRKMGIDSSVEGKTREVVRNYEKVARYCD